MPTHGHDRSRLPSHAFADATGPLQTDLSAYVMAAQWTFKSGSGDDALDVSRDDVIPVLEACRGHLRDVVVRTGQDSLLSMVWWETKEDAERAAADLAPVMIRHLGPLLRKMERFHGPVAYERLPTGVAYERLPRGTAFFERQAAPLGW